MSQTCTSVQTNVFKFIEFADHIQKVDGFADHIQKVDGNVNITKLANGKYELRIVKGNRRTCFFSTTEYSQMGGTEPIFTVPKIDVVIYNGDLINVNEITNMTITDNETVTYFLHYKFSMVDGAKPVVIDTEKNTELQVIECTVAEWYGDDLGN